MGDEREVTRRGFFGVIAEGVYAATAAAVAAAGVYGREPPPTNRGSGGTSPGDYFESVDMAYQLGLDIDEVDVRDVLGLPKPQPGQSVLTKLK